VAAEKEFIQIERFYPHSAQIPHVKELREQCNWRLLSRQTGHAP
jgi:hypothetical protein